MTEYEDLPPLMRETIVSSSIQLMRDITEAWGKDKGFELWEKISETLGDGVKGDIFFGMISGKHLEIKVRIRSARNVVNKVNMIKAVRIATGMGLKESKDFCDAVVAGRPDSVVCKTSEEARMLVTTLRELGCDAI